MRIVAVILSLAAGRRVVAGCERGEVAGHTRIVRGPLRQASVRAAGGYAASVTVVDVDFSLRWPN
jgi:hypothetical protein